MRIAHLSDIHILDWSSFRWTDIFSKRLVGATNLLTARRGKHDARLFESVCQDLKETKPDHIVLTGDVTNLSLPSEFKRAKQILSDYGLSPNEATIIPGNHDVYVREADRNQWFQTFLGAYAISDEDFANEFSTFPCVRIRGDVAFIGVNSAIPTPPFVATGFLGEAQLLQLEKLLLRLNSYFRILLIHHPPVPYRKDQRRGLVDKGKLQHVLQKTGCELVLHGHEHRDLETSLPGPKQPIPVIGVGSGTYTDPRMDRRARYKIYTIENKRLTQIETRVHQQDRARFVPFSQEKHPSEADPLYSEGSSFLSSL